jgi:hypothetical protein
VGEGVVSNITPRARIWESVRATGSLDDHLPALETSSHTQESLAATYGAGITCACVVDVGATMTSVSVVDDGLVLPDTRSVSRRRVYGRPLTRSYSIQLLVGGNDVTEFLYVLLRRVGFPYKDADLSRTYDWAMLEQLKRSMCSLSEVRYTISYLYVCLWGVDGRGSQCLLLRRSSARPTTAEISTQGIRREHPRPDGHVRASGS